MGAITLSKEHRDKEGGFWCLELCFYGIKESWRQNHDLKWTSLVQEIVFNAVALLSHPDSNQADISYVTTGVAVPMTPQTTVSVPLTGLSSGHKLTEDFKKFFVQIIGSLDTSGQFEEKTLPECHPPKFPQIYQEGRKGKMSLRPEFTPADVLITGVPAESRSSKVTENLHQEQNWDLIEGKIPIDDLKSKDQRSLILSYINMVTQNSAATSSENFDLVRLQRMTKIDKPLQFFEDFCLALYRKCLTVKKGFKVGQIFVTQVQVNMILKHGFMAKSKKITNCKSQKHSANQWRGP